MARWKLRLIDRRETERLAEERFAAGLFTSQIEEDRIFYSGPNSGRRRHGFERVVALGPDGAGPWERQSTVLSPEEYPELHALRREQRWVASRLRN